MASKEGHKDQYLELPLTPSQRCSGHVGPMPNVDVALMTEVTGGV